MPAMGSHESQAADDRELDEILKDIACQRFVPSDRLIRRTKAAIRGRRLLQAVAFLSLSTQVLSVAATAYALMSPELGPVARTFILAGLTAVFGSLAVAVVAARTRVIWFFRRIERLAG
jgi:hypothetical protein